jgi:hypothetical protein
MKATILNSLLFFLFFSSIDIFATAQYPDKIIIKGEEKFLFSNPLESYFEDNPDKRPQREDMIVSSALWRGYVATFEITNNELYVIDVEIQISHDSIEKHNFKLISVYNEVFLNSEPTKVDWLNGLLVIPYGEQIKYVHMGYGSTYAYYTLLEIQKGNLIKERNFNYREYEVFKEKQFQAFKKTKEYEERAKELREVEDNDVEFIDSFLKSFVVDYTSKILDSSEIVINLPKKIIDHRLVSVRCQYVTALKYFVLNLQQLSF